MKLGVLSKHDDPARRMWLALSYEQRAVAVSLGLYAIDEDGLPVLDGEMMASALAEITQKLEART